MAKCQNWAFKVLIAAFSMHSLHAGFSLTELWQGAYAAISLGANPSGTISMDASRGGVDATDFRLTAPYQVGGNVLWPLRQPNVFLGVGTNLYTSNKFTVDAGIKIPLSTAASFTNILVTITNPTSPTFSSHGGYILSKDGGDMIRVGFDLPLNNTTINSALTGGTAITIPSFMLRIGGKACLANHYSTAIDLVAPASCITAGGTTVRGGVSATTTEFCQTPHAELTIFYSIEECRD